MKDKVEPRAMTMFDALVQERALEAGGLTLYAEKLGIASTTLWRWTNLAIDPLAGRETSSKRRLFEDLAIPREGLEELAQLTVNEACVLLLENPHLATDTHE